MNDIQKPDTIPNPAKRKRTYRKNGSPKMVLGIKIDRELYDWIKAQPGNQIDTIEEAIRLLKMLRNN